MFMGLLNQVAHHLRSRPQATAGGALYIMYICIGQAGCR